MTLHMCNTYTVHVPTMTLHMCNTYTVHVPTMTLHMCNTYTVHVPTMTLHMCNTYTVHVPTMTLHMCNTYTVHVPTMTLHMCNTYTVYVPTMTLHMCNTYTVYVPTMTLHMCNTQYTCQQWHCICVTHSTRANNDTAYVRTLMWLPPLPDSVWYWGLFASTFALLHQYDIRLIICMTSDISWSCHRISLPDAVCNVWHDFAIPYILVPPMLQPSSAEGFTDTESMPIISKSPGSPMLHSSSTEALPNT